MPHQLTCSSCQRPIGAAAARTPVLQCDGCATTLEIIRFPALVKTIAPGSLPERLVADEASCFYHDSRQAEAACDSCGRFICTLCDLKMEDEHLCPNCLSQGRKEGKREELKKTHFCADQLALTVAALPLLFFPVTLVTGPLTIVILLYYRKHPGSLVRGNSGFRKGLALILALLQVLFWIVLFAGSMQNGGF